MKPLQTIVIAKDPADLLIQVMERITLGGDLYTPLFVSHEGLLCQRMIPTLCVYKYRLIIAQDLDDLANQERNMIELGFDYMFNTVLWNAKYLQWMSRMNESGARVRDAIAQVFTPAPAKREDELRLVEDVRAVLGMKPAASDAFEVTFPFPIRLS